MGVGGRWGGFWEGGGNKRQLTHRLLSVHCHGSVTINNAKCPLPLSADTSSWCFSPHRLPVFDNKIAPAAIVRTAAEGEHSAGCTQLRLKFLYTRQTTAFCPLEVCDQLLAWRS